MSDNFLFDSERLEQREKRKRRLLPILVLGGILLTAAAIALVIGLTKTEVHQEGADTPYPFTWQTESDGSMLLDLPHDDAPAYRWTVVNGGEDPGILSVERAEQDRRGATRFQLKPLREGRVMLELALQQGDWVEPEPAAEPTERSPEPEIPEAENQPRKTDKGPEPASTEPGQSQEPAQPSFPAPEFDTPDRLYRMSLLLETQQADDHLVCRILTVSGVRTQANVSGGANSHHPYRIFSEQNGQLIVGVRMLSYEPDWSVELLSGRESVSVRSLNRAASELQLRLAAGETPGESELLLRCELSATELRLKLLTQSDGSLIVTEHEAKYGELPADRSGIDWDSVESGKPEETAYVESSEESESSEPEPSGVATEPDGENGSTEPGETATEEASGDAR